MDRKKLVITQNLNENLVQKVQEVVPDWTLVIGKKSSIWKPDLENVEIIAGWKKDMQETLEGNTNLKWLQTWSAGVNSLPLDTLKDKGITITSANGVHSFPISETIFGLLLSLTRKIHTYVRNHQSKKWHHENMGLELHGKTIGILGVGAIGGETAKISKAFGMHVLGVRNSMKDHEYVDEMFTLKDLHEVLPRCDYVVITLPLTDSTAGLIGEKEFDMMKSTSFIINIGRGNIIAEKDLILALKEKHISGAGLDVFQFEPLPSDNPLWEMENVIVTPHTSGSTNVYDQRLIEEIFIPNLRDYVNSSKPSINLVDFKKGY
ncbi:hydroxyacid dehydrogenase [Salipaludibacillus neizhouensis]|uniref:Hydroxyacid dehydrogenase n=1 Tax=Salipaludibacillus neizhouensis TaxID=885475 RepID=A0A3A9KSS6_9BACI|nr:D-2-hydroxyacid dehydrogenase [Salipaludibacillus neizhouensis]RKL67706.1 hydroxyacid dehydrogenase [Salipaludibacillus neizhouensis]